MLSHLLTIDKLDKITLENLLASAQEKVDNDWHRSTLLSTLKHRTVANLFYEPSTRTRVSFELAALRLGATVINLDLAQSAETKGEAILDTIYTLNAMDIQGFVIRHKTDALHDQLAEAVGDSCSIINAGDGCRAHPTQALLDMLTILQAKKSFDGLSVAIVGDIKHSRVAHSDVTALKMLGVNDIRLIGPQHLLPEQNEAGVSCHTDLSQGVEDADVVIALRIQKERMQQADIPDFAQYFERYGLTESRLSGSKDDVVVMHPGPMNRGIDIDEPLADGPRSLILNQVNNGIAVRMAVLEHCLQGA